MRMQDLFTQTHRGLWLRQLADPVAERRAVSRPRTAPPSPPPGQWERLHAVAQGLTLSPPGLRGGV